MTLSAFLLFVSVYAVAVATPGPGVAAIVARSLGHGTRGAVPFILGFVIGDLVWFLGAAAGLSVLAKTYAPLFVLLRYAGCAYLLYIAVTLWRQAPALMPEQAAEASTSPLSDFAGTLLLTLGNPKVMIFFLSIMPLVVQPEAIDLGMGLELALTITVVISSILFGYMLLAAQARRLFRSPRSVRIVQRTNAAVIAGAAAVIASR